MPFLKHISARGLFPIVLSIAFAFGGVVSIAYGAEESSLSDKVESEIKAAGLLPSSRFNVAANADEVTVSTFRTASGKASDRDLKIEAALLGKLLMIEKDVGIRRLTVHFYELGSSTGYKEITVSYAEVMAFSNSAVNTEDFLRSLSLKPRSLKVESGPADSPDSLKVGELPEDDGSTDSGSTPTSKPSKAELPSSARDSRGGSPSASTASAAGNSSRSASSSTLPRRRVAALPKGFSHETYFKRWFASYFWRLERAQTLSQLSPFFDPSIVEEWSRMSQSRQKRELDNYKRMYLKNGRLVSVHVTDGDTKADIELEGVFNYNPGASRATEGKATTGYKLQRNERGWLITRTTMEGTFVTH